MSIRAEVTIRIVSYNIRLGLDSAITRIGEVLAGLGGDLVCLQEVGRFWSMGEPIDMRSALLAETGSRYGVFAPALQAGQGQYGIAVLSRFPLRVVDRRPLPRRADEPRALLACQVDTPQGQLHLLTSHLSVVDGDRPGQCRAVVDWVRATGWARQGRLVLAGDLNAQLEDPVLVDLTQALELRSALLEATGRTHPTYPTEAPEAAIDHVLVSRDLVVTGAGVAAEAGSDHLPIWADVEFER